jgi:hypothetical protein
MDLTLMVKDAACFGLACGVVAMGLALLYFLGRELMEPKIVATAVAPKPPFGFSKP